MRSAAASARSLAAYAVARLLREGVTLDAALKDALVAADSKLYSSVRSLSYGAVRGYFRHEAILGKLLSTPVRSLDFLVRALLSVALYELEDERTPEYAVVDAAVQTAKTTDAARAAGLINAVLRRYLRERKTVDGEIASRPATRHAAPIWLADRFRADWPVRWTQLLAASDAQAPMWLRVNSRLASTAGYLEQLRAAGIGARAEERVSYAIVLDSGEDKPDDHPEYFGLADFDRYRMMQAEWLKEEVKKKAFKKAKYKVVFSHIPLYNAGEWHGTQHCREAWGSILNDAGIDLMVSGHTHVYGVHPAEKGKHNYPIVIGGGPKDGKRTLIRVVADKEALKLEMLDDVGKMVGEIRV